MAHGHVRIEATDRKLIEGSYDKLRRFAAVTAPFDIEPDDLVQEALVRVLGKGPLSDRAYPIAYVRQTIVNLAIDATRKRKTRWGALARLRGTEPEMDSYPSDLAILQELTPRARAIVYLAEIEGYAYAEIAEMLGCTEAAARVGSMRARRRLRSELVEEAAHG
jgi:RNA polymerase sigma-70 factor (ECF subfamily)